MTTVNTSDEKILRDDLVKDIYFEGNAVKVYDKIYGLLNLGRSYFCTYEEVLKKADEAETQVMQKYGNEVYGQNASYAKQTQNKSSVGDTSGGATQGSVNEAGGDRPLSSGNGLIRCTVSKLKELPRKFDEEAGDFSGMKKSLDKLKDWIANASRSSTWKEQNQAEIDKLNASIAAFRPASGPNGTENQKAWKDIDDVLKMPKWAEWLKTDSSLKRCVSELWNGWDTFNGKEPGSTQGGLGPDTRDTTVGEADKKWNPFIPIRIDIQTNFDKNWYINKYKSGLLNKVKNAIKTDIMSHVDKDARKWDKMAGHKYTSDEMLPGDIKKLDKLQWEMTNNVARDYIELLLGWKREKKMTTGDDGKGYKPFTPADGMESDPEFGKKMADRALAGRGTMGKLKQKIFAGGQSNNVISVAFQLADPNDEWELVDESGNPVPASGEGDSGDGSGSGDGTGTPSGTSTGTATGRGSGSGNGTPPSDTGSSGNLDQKDVKSILTLIQRIERLEKQVGIQANESTDVVRGVCEGRNTVEQLMDSILVG